jgi:crossover junction endodeoxyribonuclease RuvC
MPAKKQLSDFAAKAPVLPTFREGWVLGVDQTITNTGWAIVQFWKDHEQIWRIEVIQTGMIKTEPTGLKGYYDTYARLDLIWDAYQALLDAHKYCELAHEMPAVFGKRTDSSMLAANTLRNVARLQHRPIHMYGAQNIKKAVTGNGNASKADVKSAVKSLAPTVVNCKPANEHTYDAVAIAIRHMRTN